MNSGELCNREVVIVERDETVQSAAKLMRQYHVGDLVVVEKRGGLAYPVGILTDRDIVIELIASEVAFEAVTVGDVMSSDLLTVSAEESIADTVKLMRARGVRRVPVINKQGVLEGIIAVDDLIELLAEQMNDLANLIGRERKREEHKCV
ncbi:MAG: CBS domain-containing protein [Desulfurivibrionaceae bacterium]|nr:CBS domain-containing protein [Desulfobulbales bacterium]MDT8334736.1 CBS domain-containing protein [Desulfurivibrionaceae bacterium]